MAISSGARHDESDVELLTLESEVVSTMSKKYGAVSIIICLVMMMFAYNWGRQSMVRPTVQVAYNTDGVAWNTTNVSPSLKWLYSPINNVQSAAYSPDGTLLAVGGDGGVQIFNSQTNTFHTSVPTDIRVVRSLAFSPDGSMLAVGGDTVEERGALELWNTSGKHLKSFATNSNQGVCALAFSSDSQKIATGGHRNAGFGNGRDGTGVLEVWNVSTGTILRSIDVEADYMEVSTVAFSPDGETLATGGGSYSKKNPNAYSAFDFIYHSALSLWSVRTGKQIKKLDTASLNWIKSLVFSHDGQTLAASGPQSLDHPSNEAVCLWNTSTWERLKAPDCDSRSADSIAFSPDSTTLALGVARYSNDNVVDLWDLTSGQVCDTKYTVAKSTDRYLGYLDRKGITALAFSPRGETLMVGSGNTVELWNSTHRKISQQDGALRSGEHEQPVKTLVTDLTKESSSLDCSPDGRMLAVGGKRLSLWNISTGQPLFGLENSDPVYSVAFSPDSQVLVAAGESRASVELWDIITKTVVKSLNMNAIEGDFGTAVGVAFAPKGNTLAVLRDAYHAFHSGDHTDIAPVLELWNASTGQRLNKLKIGGYAFSLSFSPDGKTLAVGLKHQNMVELWDVSSGELRRTLDTSSAYESINSIAFSRNGKMLAVGGSSSAGVVEKLTSNGRKLYNGVLQFWDVSNGKMLFASALASETASVNSVVFSSDGQYLFAGTSGSKLGSLQIFSIAENGRLGSICQGILYDVSSLALLSDGSGLVCHTANGTIAVMSNPYYKK